MIRLQRPRVGQAAKDRRAGFSLIELLTVIAIIAILAAVLFPVASNVRLRAQHTQLTSNMKSIHQALGIYKADENGYPPNLGPVVIGGGSTTTTFGNLYSEWLKDRSAFHSPNNEVQDTDALYLVARPDGTYVSETLPPGVSEPARINGAKIYGWNTMDGHVNLNGDYVLHYSRFRTLDKQDADYKRQLGFRNPPEDTVVTWNNTFVNDGGTPNDTTDDRGDLFVLFLNGTVKKFSMRDSRVQAVRGKFWRLKPY